MANYYANCGYLTPSPTDLTAWTAVTVLAIHGTGAAAKVGLFGYDITCLASMCAEKSDYKNYCSFLTGSGIDGWSLGVQHTYATASATVMVLGQSNAITGDVVHEEKKGGSYNVCSVLSGNYSIVATGTGTDGAAKLVMSGLYGFG